MKTDFSQPETILDPKADSTIEVKAHRNAQTGVSMRNEMELIFDAVSSNESFARMAVAAFVSHLNPTLEELADIKTAVSEAGTNSIIHGY